MSSWFWVVISLVTLALVSYSFVKLSSSRDWVATQGIVVSASIDPIYKNNSQQGQVAGQSFNYKVNISYEYSVDGQTFTGDQLTVGLPNVVSNKNDADELLATYSPSGAAKIFYNPAKPSESALITAKSVPIIGFIILGLMIIVIASVIGFIIKSGILD